MLWPQQGSPQAAAIILAEAGVPFAPACFPSLIFHASRQFCKLANSLSKNFFLNLKQLELLSIAYNQALD